ncbi:MAG: hypothetical protein FJ126_08645 [Deltaproteobacteria bacterium]|nr:hypothetical protein [Deltaproteobacteria bacterium]
MFQAINRYWRGRPPRALALSLAVMLLPLLLGADWKGATGQTINPRHVQRLKNGVTTKHEILLYFGEPQEVIRTPEGPIFKYASFKDAPALPTKPEDRQPVMTHQESSNPFYLDEKKQIKTLPRKKEGKELRSTLSIRFKPDGETMMSYEYKEY